MTQFDDIFEGRHIGPDSGETKEMLSTIGAGSLDKLIDETVPASIRLKNKLNLPAALSEEEMLTLLSDIASKNRIFKSYIGLGYYDTITPQVILRNVLENPGWYTAYTPYQAEIAQGRLEALLNFQTMIMDMTGMEIANASLLDEGTAAAEAMTMLFHERPKNQGNLFLVSDQCFPQTIDILKTRANPLGIEISIQPEDTFTFDETVFGILLQYPGKTGAIKNYTKLAEAAHGNGSFVAVAADLLSLALITPPGEWGADVVVGNTQRFGVPMGYGGPHAGYFATRDEFKRQMPGRIIGVSIDANGNQALRMALQTREQHIRREKATSNICTAQVLLAVMAGMYAVYHGPAGIRKIAGKVNGLARLLDKKLKALGYEQVNKDYFDTLAIEVSDAQKETIKIHAVNNEMNFNFDGRLITISLDETTGLEDVSRIVELFASAKNTNGQKPLSTDDLDKEIESGISSEFRRNSDYLTHPVFNVHHSETEMLRYLKSLENKDLSLTHSMIPLGSCTMKLNATTEMRPVTWREFGGIHPFAPADQALGYSQVFNELSEYLKEITGFAGISLQPNSGAQGEYTGLMVIREYFRDRGETHRNVALIPQSAHGTNPASAVMAGMKVVVTKTDEHGNIDVEDLKNKAEQYRDELACLMVTYPSTHGVFEESIKQICDLIHANGGQVYMDGANMNAQVGLTSPGMIGADVCHLNLHKTFCIPHGGGGPGMGPIGVAAHLVPFLPGHAVVKTGGEKGIHAVSAAPWGSASILLISYVYIRLMGSEGLTNATRYAILNANYIKARLEKYYDILYAGSNGRCAHEMIVDMRKFKASGIEVEDIAKRLMDYGFHAPTVSFPVAGTLMIEPTESEPKSELDRFCDALIAIRSEIEEIESGAADKADNVLKNAPHTVKSVTADEWSHNYSRKKAAYPVPYLEDHKFWPAVARVNNSFGDRNLICSCPAVEEYETQEAVA